MVWIAAGAEEVLDKVGARQRRQRENRGSEDSRTDGPTAREGSRAAPLLSPQAPKGPNRRAGRWREMQMICSNETYFKHGTCGKDRGDEVRGRPRETGAPGAPGD